MDDDIQKPVADNQKPRKISLSNLDGEEAEKHHSGADLVTSPGSLRKSSSTRSNCLCSPTTHVGSFRCRLHRNGGNMRRGHSVGSNLSDLANKCDPKSDPPHFDKPLQAS